jgi:hypothetical protein
VLAQSVDHQARAPPRLGPERRPERPRFPLRARLAEELVRDDNRAAFYEAATAPRFRASAGTGLPEMFHFCCVAFDPAVVRQQLLGELPESGLHLDDLAGKCEACAVVG